MVASRALRSRDRERLALCAHTHEQALAIEELRCDARAWARECAALEDAAAERASAAVAEAQRAHAMELAAVRRDAEAARAEAARVAAAQRRSDRDVRCCLYTPETMMPVTGLFAMEGCNGSQTISNGAAGSIGSTFASHQGIQAVCLNKSWPPLS